MVRSCETVWRLKSYRSRTAQYRSIRSMLAKPAKTKAATSTGSTCQWKHVRPPPIDWISRCTLPIHLHLGHVVFHLVSQDDHPTLQFTSVQRHDEHVLILGAILCLASDIMLPWISLSVCTQACRGVNSRTSNHEHQYLGQQLTPRSPCPDSVLICTSYLYECPIRLILG